MEPTCAHKEYDHTCSECQRTRLGKDMAVINKAKEIESKVIKAYEEGGFRGITKYILEITR